MTPFLQLAFELVVILLAAKAAGYISTRLGQPSVLGELLIGVLLGPSLVNILGLPFISSSTLGGTISDLSELGVLLLMFIAGLELHLGELTSHRRVSLLASVGGLILSIGLGWGGGRLFGMTGTAALLLGLALGATSVSISARTLMEMGVLRSRVGLSLLGAAVVDDILSILAFSIFLAVTTGSGGFLGVGFAGWAHGPFSRPGYSLSDFGFSRRWCAGWVAYPSARACSPLPLSPCFFTVWLLNWWGRWQL